MDVFVLRQFESTVFPNALQKEKVITKELMEDGVS